MQVRGDSGPDAGAPVLLLHGQPGSAADWLRVAPLLTGRVLAVDRPGYGADTGPAEDWRGNARQAAQLLEGLAAGPAVVVGYSWAAGAALELALDRPELVRALVLLAPAADATSLGWGDRLLAHPRVARLVPGVMALAGVRGVAVLEQISGSRLDAAARGWFEQEARAWSATGAWQTFADEQRWLVRDAAALGRRLACVLPPVQILHGVDDRVVPFAAAGALAAAMPSAVLRAVRGGHLLPWEAPEQVAACVATALGD